MYILAQIFGIFGIITLFLSVQFNSKKQILRFQTAANLFYAIQYLLLNAITASLMSFVSVFRCIVFFIFEKKNKKVPIYILVVFLALIIILAKFLNYGIMGFLPVVCTLLYTIGIWQRNLNVFRIITLITACIWVGYNVFVGAYPSLIGNVFEILTALIAIYRFNLSESDNKKRKKRML